MNIKSEVERIRRALGLRPIVASARRPWKEWLHPRDKFGRWIEKFSFVHVDGEMSGIVERMNRDGTVTVHISKDLNNTRVGARLNVTPGQIETVAVKAMIPDASNKQVVPRTTEKYIKGKRPWTPSRPVLTGGAVDLGNGGTWAALREALRGKDIIVFDTETTGFNVDTKEDSVIQLGAVRIRDGKIVDRFETFVKPGHGSFDNDFDPVPSIITKITGITRDDVRDAPDANEAFASFADWANLGGPDTVLAAHNANFDMAAIRNMTGDDTIIPDDVPVLDTLSLARAVLPKDNSPIQSRKLGDLAEYFGVQLNNWHRADADAEAAGLLIDKLLAYGSDNNSPTGALKNLDLQNRTFDSDYDKYIADLINARREDLYLHHLKTGGIPVGSSVVDGNIRNKRDMTPIGEVTYVMPGVGYMVKDDKGEQTFYDVNDVLKFDSDLLSEIELDRQMFESFNPDRDLADEGDMVLAPDGKMGKVVGVVRGADGEWVYQIQNQDGSYRFYEAHTARVVSVG